jgi:hypothetical protein
MSSYLTHQNTISLTEASSQLPTVLTPLPNTHLQPNNIPPNNQPLSPTSYIQHRPSPNQNINNPINPNDVLTSSAQLPQRPPPTDIRSQRLKDLPADSCAYLTTFDSVQGASWLAETKLMMENNPILAKTLRKRHFNRCQASYRDSIIAVRDIARDLLKINL